MRLMFSVIGLHLTGAGYTIVFDELIEVLKRESPEYPPYKMPFEVKVGWELERGEMMWDMNN